MVTVYQAGSQLGRVRFIAGFAFLCALGSIVAGVHLAQSHELVWAAIVLPLGFGFALGMWIYVGCYVAQMDFDESEQRVVIKVAGVMWKRIVDFPVAQITTSTGHAGRSYTGRISVNAPWRSVRVGGRRLPFVLDMQGRILDEKLFYRILRGNAQRAARKVR